MKEDDNKTFDLFGMSDIDKIQNDIERDLQNLGELKQEQESNYSSLRTVFFQNPPQAAEITPSVFESLVKPPRGTSWVKTAIIIFLVCTLGTGTLGFGIGTGFGRFRNESQENIPGAELVFETTSFVFETIEEQASVGSLADMVELLLPSIVAITTHRDETSILPRVTHASGIIFAEDDSRIFIATSLSVVRNASHWNVSINGSRPIRGFPVGRDVDSDLAVMGVNKIDMLMAGIRSVVIATFGSSEEMRVGDVVLAIGNAMGDGISVTRGIISASEDFLVLPGRLPPLLVLQTDAAINMGSSGGALVNMRGEVVGININHASNIFGTSPVEGMGYSISSSFAAPILYRMVFSPTPAIGIYGGTVTAEIAENLGIPQLGVFVSHVFEGRAAYRAGIQAGDVITVFNGQPVFTMLELQTMIRSLNVGDEVELNILRDGTQIVKNAVLMYMPLDNF